VNRKDLYRNRRGLIPRAGLKGLSKIIENVGQHKRGSSKVLLSYEKEGKDFEFGEYK
jgi:hypothetical protein